MKVRTLIAIAASGFLAASLAHAAPDASMVADDAAMDSGTAQSPAAGDNLGSMNDQATPGTDSSQMPTDTMPSSGTGTGTEDGSADTATGDDDY